MKSSSFQFIFSEKILDLKIKYLYGQPSKIKPCLQKSSRHLWMWAVASGWGILTIFYSFRFDDIHFLSSRVPFSASWEYCCWWCQWRKDNLLWFWNDGKVLDNTCLPSVYEIASPTRQQSKRINLNWPWSFVVILLFLCVLQYQFKYQRGFAGNVLWSVWEGSRQGTDFLQIKCNIGFHHYIKFISVSATSRWYTSTIIYALYSYTV